MSPHRIITHAVKTAGERDLTPTETPRQILAALNVAGYRVAVIVPRESLEEA